MAEKNEELLSREEKVTHAKEYFGRGSRNFLVRDYSEAAEDFSRACELYAELYGDNAEELGLPHLFYAKALVKLAQNGENKVLALQNEENDDESEQPEEDGEADDDDDDAEDENGINNQILAAEIKSSENQATSTSVAAASSSSTSSADPQPSTSTGITTDTNGGTSDTPDDDEDATNLQYAWEALEIAVKIFEQMGEKGLAHLADAYYELAEISLENDHCDVAIRDYGEKIVSFIRFLGFLIIFSSFSYIFTERATELYRKLADDNARVIAESKYKIGLCYYATNHFDESIKAFKEASETLGGIIDSEKEKEEDESTAQSIQELEDMRQEIAVKIQEVLEAKEQVNDEIKFGVLT